MILARVLQNKDGEQPEHYFKPMSTSHETTYLKTKAVIKLFLAGIFFSSVMLLPVIMDFTLVPRFISLALFLTLASYAVYKIKDIPTIKLDSILLCYIAYTFYCCITILWAKSKSEALFESLKLLLSLAVFVFTFFSLKINRAYFLSKTIGFSVVILLLELAATYLQFTSLTELNKDSIYLITGLNSHKNLFSSFLFLNLFFLILAVNRYQKQWRVLAVAALILNLILLLFLRTKAVWLGLSVTAVVALFLYAFLSDSTKVKPKIDLPVLILLITLTFNVFFFNLLQPLIQKSIDYTSQLDANRSVSAGTVKLEEERLILWDKTYEIFKQDKFSGIGMGNWQIQFPKASLTGLWRAEDLNYTFQRPHNDFLWILSETGLIGFNLFILFLSGLISAGSRTLRSITSNSESRLELILCIAFIGGYFTLSFFDFPKERMEHNVWIGIIFGIAYYHIKNNYPLKNFGELKLSKPFLLMGLFVMIFITYTGTMRFKGEYYVRKMFDYKNTNQKTELIKAGYRAVNYVYSIDPTSVPVHWYTGNAQAALGNYAKAHSDFVRAYRYNPYNRNLLNDLASSFVYNNDIKAAKSHYRQAARISPRFDDPKLNLAAIYINEKNFKKADSVLNALQHDSERRSAYQRIVDLEK